MLKLKYINHVGPASAHLAEKFIEQEVMFNSLMLKIYYQINSTIFYSVFEIF